MLWVELDVFPDIRIIKYGTVDDRAFLDEAVPTEEIYVSGRWKWVKGVEGAMQKMKA